MGENSFNQSSSENENSQLTPIRKRRAELSIMQSLQDSDDNDEREKRRCMVDVNNRISNINSEVPDIENEAQATDHIKLCTKLFNENKINNKNVWNLHIIDVLQHLTKKSNSDLLKMAGTSLDIASKIYSLRVDDLHTKGMQLAKNLSRTAENAADEVAATSNDGDENDSSMDNQVEGGNKKKRTRIRKNRSVISQDPEKDLNGPLPKLDSVLFTPRTHLDVGVIGNLFTNTLSMNSTCTKFNLFAKENHMPNGPDPMMEEWRNNREKRKYKLGLSNKDFSKFKICTSFDDFKMDEWKETDDKDSDSTENPLEVVYDNNGVPIPELDGTFNELMEDDTDNYADLPFEEMVAEQQHGPIEKIETFTPSENTQTVNEYSYNTLLQTNSGKYIDKIWFGPSHWKFKHVQPRGARTTTSSNTGIKRGQRKKAEMVDYENIMETQLKKYEPLDPKKLRSHTSSYSKITMGMPLTDIPDFNQYISGLQTKPGVIPVIKDPKESELREIDVVEYNYDNLNDSQYCPLSGDVEGCDNRNDVSEINDPLPEENFLGENLIGAPEVVQKTNIPYAMKAKKVNMKKLKTACWDELSKGKENMSGTKKFSELYKVLGTTLPDKMISELSPHLAFLSLLHNANDHNLKLKKEGDEVVISQDKQD